jgi:putative FmdB family regulatory protein
MPTYEYACKSCGQHLEVVQSFSDDALTTCPACGGHLRKVFGNIGISFKGTGFYKNDSRSSTRSGVPSASSDGGGSGSGSSGESGSSDSGAPAKEAASTKEAPAPAKEAAKDTGGASRAAPTKPAAAAS